VLAKSIEQQIEHGSADVFEAPVQKGVKIADKR
jgi:hypothetical protein